MTTTALLRAFRDHARPYWIWALEPLGGGALMAEVRRPGLAVCGKIVFETQSLTATFVPAGCLKEHHPNMETAPERAENTRRGLTTLVLKEQEMAAPVLPSIQPGDRFGLLAVVSEAPWNRRELRWLCLCDCGRDRAANNRTLLSGQTISCGCIRRDGRRRVDPGARYGSWVTVNPIGRKNYWLCRCDCGTERAICAGTLHSGQSRSCGCRRFDKTVERPPVNPRRELRKIWGSMLARCHNPSSSGFRKYGARGIEVCERWRDFENFLADMGERPGPQFSIERTDNNGDYAPSNCRWATAAEQSRNRRTNRNIEFRGQTKCLYDWAEALGVSPDKLSHCLISEPVDVVFARLMEDWHTVPTPVANALVTLRRETLTGQVRKAVE